MERNWDVIRNILLTLEEHKMGTPSLSLDAFPIDEELIYAYHLQLLLDAKLIQGDALEHLGSSIPMFVISNMTWEGHELLDAIRSETVWDKTKKTFAEKGVAMTFDLVKSIATEITTSYLKASLS